MYTPDPEPAASSETKVEITNLDSPGKLPGRSPRQSRGLSFRVRIWMSLVIIAGIALLIIIVLVSVSQTQHGRRATVPPVPVEHPISLSVVNGICYASSTDGTVTALRVRDGSPLWRHEGGAAGEALVTVVDGVVYLAPIESATSTVTVEALRASDGSPLWSRTLPTDSSLPLQLTIASGIVYVSPEDRIIDALRASDGSVLWHYNLQTPLVSLPPLEDGAVFAGTQDGHLYALRASDGSVLWQHASHIPLDAVVVADGNIFLSLQGGSVDVLHAGTGAALWRYTPHTPAARLLLPLLVTNDAVYAETQDGYLSAWRASDGVVLWHVALHIPNFLSLRSGPNGVMYVNALDGSLEALRTSNGSTLWRYQGGAGTLASITVAPDEIYLAFGASGLNSIGKIIALRASDGTVLWRYIPHISAWQVSPAVADSLVLIALQDESIAAVDARSGSLRWHRAIHS